MIYLKEEETRLSKGITPSKEFFYGNNS